MLLKGKGKMSSATAETFLAFIELRVCRGVLCPNGENYTLGMMNQSFLGAQYLQHGCRGSFVRIKINCLDHIAIEALIGQCGLHVLCLLVLGEQMALHVGA